MWNTVTIQYNPLIEEEWDEHFKVTCEYGYDFWKTVTFPFLDVEWVWLFQKVARNAPKKIGLIKSLLHLIGSQIFQAFTDTFLIVHMTFIFFAWWKIWHSSRWIKPILHPAKSKFSQWQPRTQIFKGLLVKFFANFWHLQTRSPREWQELILHTVFPVDCGWVLKNVTPF